MISASRIVLLIGVFLIVLAAFGVRFPGVDSFMLGVGVCFAAGLVP
jgi:hypothetical protein